MSDPNSLPQARGPQQEMAGPKSEIVSIVQPQPGPEVVTRILQVLNNKIERFAVAFSKIYGSPYLSHELGNSTLAKFPETAPPLLADLIKFGISKKATGNNIVVPCLRCLMSDRLLQTIFGIPHQGSKELQLVGDDVSWDGESGLFTRHAMSRSTR